MSARTASLKRLGEHRWTVKPVPAVPAWRTFLKDTHGLVALNDRRRSEGPALAWGYWVVSALPGLQSGALKGW
jgi:hypothetical protein